MAPLHCRSGAVLLPVPFPHLRKEEGWILPMSFSTRLRHSPPCNVRSPLPFIILLHLTTFSCASGAQVTNRPPSRGQSVRVEATGFVRFDRTDLETSGGTKSYWFRLSSEKDQGRTTGGFSIDFPNRMTGTATDFQPSPPRPASGPGSTDQLR